MTEKEILITTLIQNGLAASRSEAQRMADDMITTSDKVNEGIKKTRDNYMVSNFKEEQAKEAVVEPAPQPSISGTPKEQRIQELRQNAINPQPIHIQTEFDTPSNDQKTDWTQEPTVEEPASEPAQEPLVEEPVAQEPQQMTPEEYAAQQMNNMGANTVSDLTSEAPQVEISTSALEAGLPEQALESEAPLAPEDPVASTEEVPLPVPGDFISQEPAPEPAQEPLANLEETKVPEPEVPQQPAQDFSAEPSAPEQPEIHTQQESQPEPTPEPEKKKSRLTEEEQKLADDVDLSKVFNFSNR